MVSSRVRNAALSLLALCLAPSALAANWPERPVVRAVRAVAAPHVDGDLSDPAWAAAPEITDFTQHEPSDGQPATQKTSVRIVYDDDALYVGAFLHDDGKVTPLLARRDAETGDGDFFGISIDAHHDRLSGAYFEVNPSNVQFDMVLFDDTSADVSWDAVYDSAAKIVPGGWSAEMRIPYSQLRFPRRDEHTWGINFWRKVHRLSEVTRLVNTPKGGTGEVSHFADLVGIEGISPKRGLEVVPYAVARGDVNTRFNEDNPFMHGFSQTVDAGLDVKYGLTSNLTLTGTVNPDFGQVEVDPAVINLSQFETFFPEKRPFFTEGASIFRFGYGPANSRFNFNFGTPTFFYSRRIGRAPQARLDGDWVDAPNETTILGAAKLTGKAGKGWSIGVLDALTAEESGWFERDGFGRGTGPVEPMTNYFVARAAKEYAGNSRIGAMFMSVNRRLGEELEPTLRSSAYVGGIDGYTLFRDKTWTWEWQASGSLVEGSESALDATQRSAARYYHRPDAGHVELDPSRTSLTGWGGRAMLAKQTGNWRPNFQLQAYSPGFEINDIGFLSRTDIIASHATMLYVDQKVRKYTREKAIWVGRYHNRNFDGDVLANGVHANANFELKDYSEIGFWAGKGTSRIDDRRTRGGPVAELPGNWIVGMEYESDDRKKFSAGFSQEIYEARDGGRMSYTSLEFNYRPTPALRLSFNPSLVHDRTFSQYVTRADDPAYTLTNGVRYLFATLDQKTLDLGVRADWTLNSKLSVQLYLQPFVASGQFHDYKQLVRGRDDDYASFAPEQVSYDAREDAYTIRTGGPVVGFSDPDFNFRSVRGNAVVRWEFRPGSALYFVWNENRFDEVPVGEFRPRRDLAALGDAQSRDVFLIKVSYWLPL